MGGTVRQTGRPRKRECVFVCMCVCVCQVSWKADTRDHSLSGVENKEKGERERDL